MKKDSFDFIFSIVLLLSGVVTYDLFDNILGFSYVDELLVLVLGIRYFARQGWKLSSELFILACIFTFYVTYSLCMSITSCVAIIKDSIVLLKPFLAFYFVLGTPLTLTQTQKQWLQRLCIGVTICLIPVALTYMMTNPRYFDEYFQPSRYATIATCTAFFYLYLSLKRPVDWFVSLLIMFLGLASLRAKAIGFFAGFSIIALSIRYIRRTKLTPKLLLGGAMVSVVVIMLLSWSKFSYYFIEDVVDSWQLARPSLYKGMVQVLYDYPLFGSGFGTYATSVSGEYYSSLYSEYGLDGIDGLRADGYEYIADAFFASLAQYGLVGILLFLLFWRKRIKEAYTSYCVSQNVDTFLIVVLITIFFIIESTADSTLTQNRGVFMMMILGMASHDLYKDMKKKIGKRVFVIGTRGIPDIMGGVETHCEELFPRIVDKGVDVTVVRRSTYVKDALQEWHGVQLLDVKSPQKKSFEAIIHTWRAIWRAKKECVNIVHIHAIGPGLLCPLAKLLGMKVVFTHHGPDYDRDKWGTVAKSILKLGERMACMFADEVIVISNVIKNLIEHKYGRVNHVHLIYNGVPQAKISEFDEYFRALGIEKGKYVLGMCRFVPEKNLHHLVEAFSMIDNKGCKLVLAGDADFEDSYSKSLKQNALKNGVVLTGFIKGRKLHSLLSNCKAYCLPSSHEGLPIALLEAMSYGARVVVSDIPANMEVGLPSDCYFPCGDVAALSMKLQSVVDAEYKKVKYDMSKYDWDAIAQQVLDVYQLIK